MRYECTDRTELLVYTLRAVPFATKQLEESRGIRRFVGAGAVVAPTAAAAVGVADDEADEPLAIAPGNIVVKRDRPFGGAQFHLLGTWAATPIAAASSELDDDDQPG